MPADPDPAQPTPTTPRTIVFVCTGNTCRSPLAEVLCRKLLAERLDCRPEALADRGYVVLSAGVAAMPGDAPSGPAVDVAREFGADLAGHRSRSVTPQMLDRATAVVTMTRAHAVALAQRFPGVGPPPVSLCGDDGDLPDPIGGDLPVYRACAGAIAHHLRRLLPAWVESRP